MFIHFKKIWLLKYNYLFLIVIALIILIGLSNFLYTNFYLTIAQTNEIALLQSEVALDSIDTELFEKNQQAIKDKEAGNPTFLTPPQTKWLDLKNPFAAY